MVRRAVHDLRPLRKCINERVAGVFKERPNHQIERATIEFKFQLQRNPGYGFVHIGSSTQSWQANKWYRIEVMWMQTGEILARLYDSDGVTLLNTVSAFDSTVASGGIAFRAFGGAKFFDSVKIIAATAGTSTISEVAAASGDPPFSPDDWPPE